MNARILGVVTLLSLGSACEWPFRAATVSLRSQAWTDRVAVDLTLEGVGIGLFPCETLEGCVDSVRAGLAVPTTPSSSAAPSERLGERLAQGGAESLTLTLVARDAEVDLRATFAAPTSARVFSEGWIGLTLLAGGAPTLTGEGWALVGKPVAGATLDGSTLRIDLGSAPSALTLRRTVNPDTIPLPLALPGLDATLRREGLIAPE